LAIHEVYPDAEAMPCATFEDCFAAITSGDADIGMIPIENSVAGRVADIHHLMPHAGLHIVGEHFMPVRHQLLAVQRSDACGHQDGREPRPCARPMPQGDPADRNQTDRGGRHRRLGTRSCGSRRQDRASIATRLAAEIYGLDILRADVEDEAHNTTRFIMLAREAVLAQETAMARWLRPPVPGAQRAGRLYKTLGGFATNGVNMTKLESYMIEGNFFATQFYADVEGHPDDRKLVFAFEELAFYSKEMRILGVYPAHKFRRGFEEQVGRRVTHQLSNRLIYAPTSGWCAAPHRPT